MLLPYHQTEHIEMVWNSDSRTVEMTWRGFVFDEEYREALFKAMLLMRGKGAHQWLADMRQLQTLYQADRKWTVGSFAARPVGAGLRRVAMLLPQRRLARHVFEEMMQDITGTLDVTVVYFDQLETARRWLAAFAPAKLSGLSQ